MDKYVISIYQNDRVIDEAEYASFEGALMDWTLAVGPDGNVQCEYTLHRVEGDVYVDVTPPRPWELVKSFEDQFNNWFNTHLDGGEWKL